MWYILHIHIYICTYIYTHTHIIFMHDSYIVCIHHNYYREYENFYRDFNFNSIDEEIALHPIKSKALINR